MWRGGKCLNFAIRPTVLLIFKAIYSIWIFQERLESINMQPRGIFIFFSLSNICTNNEIINTDVWLRCNKLSVNVKKTTYLIFTPWQKKCDHNFSISLSGQLLTQTNVTKFLGVYIDEHLTWKDHFSYLCKQISKSIGIVIQVRLLSIFKNLTHLMLLANLSLCHLL